MNYIGGKYKLLPQLMPLFPQNINTFVDLFAGGFNVAVNVKSNKTICNDLNYLVVEMVRTLAYADIDIVLKRIDEKIAEGNRNYKKRHLEAKIKNGDEEHRKEVSFILDTVFYWKGYVKSLEDLKKELMIE